MRPEYIPKDYCARCKTKEDLMPKPYSKISASRMCRKCNTERAKKYRNTIGKSNIKKAAFKAYNKHTDKQLSRSKLNYALKLGKISKPKNCEICKEIMKLEAHHTDYAKPLVVNWYCRPCHSDVHRLTT